MLALTLSASPARAANGVEASGHVLRSPQAIGGTYKVEFGCEAHGTVVLSAVAIDACDLYRRTPTGWRKVASAEPRTGVPGQAAATVGTYDLPVSKLSSLRVCWRANGLTRDGSRFVSDSGCTSGS